MLILRQWHGWTRSSTTSIFLSEIYHLFVENILSSFSILKRFQKVKKLQRCPFRWLCIQSEERSKRDTKKIFTGHGLRIIKRSAVWYFSIFLFEKYQFLLEIFYLHLESSSASRKWKNLNVVLFADSVHRVRRDPSVTLKKYFLRILPDKIQNTVRKL